jgi:hypothetical protein
MRFNILFIPSLLALVSARPTAEPAGADLFARDEYRWCLGTIPKPSRIHQPN